MSIANPLQSWWLAGNNAFVIYNLDNMIRSRRRTHISAFCEWNRIEEDGIEPLTTGLREKTE
jgi:hypothetical protein